MTDRRKKEMLPTKEFGYLRCDVLFQNRALILLLIVPDEREQ
jgi:hypothetical protein